MYIVAVVATGSQGEANSDEGYHRNTREYACEFKALITSWRQAWGYTLPFFCAPYM